MTRTGAGFGWKYFPYYLIGAMAVVVAVNARFITIAVTTFPGEVTAQDFETSNRYDTIWGGPRHSARWAMASRLPQPVRAARSASHCI